MVYAHTDDSKQPLSQNTDPGTNVNASIRLCVCMNVNDLGIIWASRSTVHTWRCVHTVEFVVTDYAITPSALCCGSTVGAQMTKGNHQCTMCGMYQAELLERNYWKAGKASVGKCTWDRWIDARSCHPTVTSTGCKDILQAWTSPLTSLLSKRVSFQV